MICTNSLQVSKKQGHYIIRKEEEHTHREREERVEERAIAWKCVQN